ncbi:MAG: hypothetical protein HY751_07140 [Nitrospinae bacterium]|nr:hypothetical protein [Nitrospinota bacterium]
MKQPGPAGKTDLPPIGVLIILSIVFPGAGQLANNQKVKGWIIVGVSVLIAIAFFFQLAVIASPVHQAIMSGRAPTVDDQFIDGLKKLLWILSGALAVWLVAMVDAVLVGRKNATAKRRG